MPFDTTRRSLLRASLAAPLAAGMARAGAPLKVGFIYVAPVGDAGWTFQHELGRRAMDSALGAAVKSTYVENVAEGADAERVIRQLATDGNALIFATSFGYMNPTAKVAAQFPQVKFDHATGYKRATNLGTYSARFYEGRYVTGVIAGHMSKTGLSGYVAAFPIPEVVQGINAFTLGARSVNPKFETKVVWTSNWFDPGRERAAADTLIAQGADIMNNHTDSTAVVQAAEEKGVWSFSYSSDMMKYGARTCLTGVVMVWGGYYTQTARAVIDGAWKSDDVWGGFKDGMLTLAPYNAALPQEVKAISQATIEKLSAGGLVPFAGPIVDQGGQLRVAASASLSDPDILGMKWFVEGVQGKLG